MNPAATERSFFAVLLLYVAGLVFCVGLGLSAGAVSISWPEMLQVVKSFYSPVPELDSSNVAILIARVWRILACVCIGASLALCGSVLQRLLRNPLADPFVLGVSAGGTTAVVTTLVLFGVPLGSYVWGIQVQFLASLVGCIGALLFVLMLKRKLSAASAESTLPLVGLVLNAFLSSVLMVVVSLADPFRMAEAQRWMLGFVSFVTPWQVGILATVLIVAGGFLLFMRKAVDALAFGHDFARSVGVCRKKLPARGFGLGGSSGSCSGLCGFYWVDCSKYLPKTAC